MPATMLMDTAYYNFYRNFYMRTNGFIPSKPLNQPIYPGDFFQIRNGEIIVLGNIFRNNIIDPAECRLGYGIKLNPASWQFSDGVTKSYSGRGSGQRPVGGEFEFSKQILAFAAKGSFIFRGNEPEAVKILNWSDVQQQLIIRLTQTYYSFRKLYVAVECATTADWTMALGGADNAELEMSTSAENFGLVDIFGQDGTRTIQSRDIEFYQRELNRKPVFFKAKKLVVQDEKLEAFISELISTKEEHAEWVGNFYGGHYHDVHYTPEMSENARASILDMLHGNELNPNTALLYFRWGDASLDDIEKLFIINGD